MEPTTLVSPIRRRVRRAARRRSWLNRVLVGVVLLISLGAAATAFYRHQVKQNTLRLLHDARFARDLREWTTAADHFRQYLRRSPADRTALAEYVDFLLQHGDDVPSFRKDALQPLRRLADLDPRSTERTSQLTQLYLALGEAGRAADSARRWRRLDPNSVDAILAQAQGLVESQQSSAAINELLDAIRMFPRELRLFPPLIEMLAQVPGRSREADEITRQAINAFPDSTVVQMAAFSFYQNRGDAFEAELRLQHALELAPHSADTLARAAMFYLSAGRLADAEQLKNHALELDPTNRLVLSVRAALAVRSGDLAQIRATADVVLASAKPADLDRIAQAAELFLRSGDADRADELIQKLDAVPRPGQRLTLWLDTLRGALSHARGNPYAAIPLLERSLQRDSKSIWPTELLATCYIQIGAFNEAAPLLRQLTIFKPQDTAVRCSLASLELDRDNCDAVRSTLAPIRDATDSLSPQVELFELGCALKDSDRSGRHDAARLEGIRDRLQELAKAPPNNDATIGTLVSLLIRTDQLQSALTVVRDVSAASQARIQAAVQVGRALLSRKQFDECLALSDELIRNYSDRSEGYALRVEALAGAGKTQEALTHVQGDDVPPKIRGQLWVSYGEMALSRNEKDDALRALHRAAELRPDDIPVRETLIRCAHSLDEARRLCNEIRAIEGDAGMEWRFLLAASLLHFDGTRDAAAQAEQLLKTGLASRPSWTAATLMLGFAQEKTGNLAEAAESYRLALSRDAIAAQQPAALHYISVLRGLGRNEEADALLDRLSSALPGSPDILRLDVQRHDRLGEYDKAAAIAEQVMTLQPDDPAWSATTADLQLRSGNPARAEELARDALVQHPDSLPLLRSLARTMRAQGRGNEAEKFLSDKAQCGDRPAIRLVFAEFLLDENKPGEADKEVTKALAASPSDAAVIAAAVEFCAVRGNREKQIELLRRLSALRGDDASIPFQLASLLAEGDASQQQEADAIVRQRLAANPRDVSALLIAARLSLRAAPPRMAEAEDTLKRAVSKDSRDARPARALAHFLQSHNRMSEAAATLRDALTDFPQDVELLLLSAQVHVARGNSAQALAVARRLLELRPRYQSALGLLVDACRLSGKFAPCRELLETIPATQRTPMETVHLASVLDAQHETSQAEETLRSASARISDDATLFLAYSHFLAKHDRIDDLRVLASDWRSRFPQEVKSLSDVALLLCNSPQDEFNRLGFEWLNEIAGTKPNRNSDDEYRVGLCAYARGDVAVAERSFATSLQLNPDSPQAVNALAWIESEEDHQPQKALSRIERFLAKHDPPSAEALDTMAAALIRLGEWDPARNRLIECLDLSGATSTRAPAMFRLGTILIKQGFSIGGSALIRQSIELDNRLGGLSEQQRERAADYLHQSTHSFIKL